MKILSLDSRRKLEIRAHRPKKCGSGSATPLETLIVSLSVFYSPFLPRVSYLSARGVGILPALIHRIYPPPLGFALKSKYL